jgi:hypothetical protein
MVRTLIPRLADLVEAIDRIHSVLRKLKVDVDRQSFL